MKRIILLVCVFLLTGCGLKYPESASLNIQVPTQSSLVYTTETASLRGRDARENPEVVTFRVKKEPVVKVLNTRRPHIIITERIAEGLRAQGLLFAKNSDVHILLELNLLLVTVTKAKLLYNSEAVSQVVLKVTNRNTSLTRKFKRETTRKSISLPKIDTLENMLNDQLANIVNQILGDVELQEMVKKK